MSFKVSRNRRASGFAQIPNAALRDCDLSARARGVLSYMLSHADGFEITRKLIGEAFPEGRDAIDSALRELREAGYLRSVREQGDRGRFMGAQYVVYDERGAALDAADHDPENPEPGEPLAGARKTRALENRSPGKQQPYKNTNSLEHQPEEHKEHQSEIFASEFAQFWAAYPRRIGKGQAERAFKAARKKVSLEVIMSGLHDYRVMIDRNGTQMQFVRHASTWLNGECWADELHVDDRQQTAAEQMLDNFDWGDNGQRAIEQ